MGFLLKGAHVVDPALGIDDVLDVRIENDRIVEVGSELAASDGAELLDFSGKYLVPGLVDMHVHLRDPGQEYKEDIESGTRAAAKGGFTGVCSMPNTDPVTDTGSVVSYILARAAEVGHCRVYPSGAMTHGLGGEALSEMGDMVERGVVAFTDDGRGIQGAGMVRTCMDYGKMFDKVFMSHCQDESLVGAGQINEGPVSTKLGLAPWPAEGEEIQIARDIDMARLTGAKLHIQHITTERGLNLVRAAKQEGLPVTCEVTPHHLLLCDEDIDRTYDTNLKVNPPLRTKADLAALRAGLVDGTVDALVTDHAPHAAWEKAREFALAPFGMTGIETSLALMLTHFVKPGIIGFDRLVELMSIVPRRILGIKQVQIAPGSLADITVFDPTVVWTVGADGYESKSSNCAFHGRELTGRATDVFVGGAMSLREGSIV
ncbi:dihydroorotase [Collinsella sp. AGMB00827]|uniref:Dihydroorotase n=1 Tax=Collinsella ureilytica TaxID=2869515 RepID=A0ABS7MKR5_9ACTN|nr:dihydroorotase [Collinsella urealyticum]MBY4797956.1 dihydroorotase [Collinsella urealyticum]